MTVKMIEEVEDAGVNAVEEIVEEVEVQVHLAKAKEVVGGPLQKEEFLFRIFHLK